MAAGLDVQLIANSPKLSAVRIRFFSEPGMNDGMGHLVENDLPNIGFVTHRKQARRDRYLLPWRCV